MAWLRHRGRTETVAAKRFTCTPRPCATGWRKLRELFGDALEDPDRRFELELALRIAPSRRRRISAMAADLSGKVAAITGASSGIGEATALALAGAGAKVALGARRKDRLDELVGRIGDAALAIEADVADESQARRFVETAHSELGGLDILVNNAGVMLLGPGRGRRHRGVAADGEREPARAPLLHARRAAADARGRGRAHRQRVLGGRPQRDRRVRPSTT